RTVTAGSRRLWKRLSHGGSRTGSTGLLVCHASLAKKAHLGDGFFELGKGHGTWSPFQDQLQDLGIRHPFDTTEIGHHGGHGPAHTGTATDHDPTFRHMALDPTDSAVQQERLRFTKL